MANDKEMTRREFLNRSALTDGSLLFTSSLSLFAGTIPAIDIKSKDCAAIDTSGKLVPWEFERRPVGDDDILIVNGGGRCL